MITAVNPKIIAWARKRSGLTIEDLAGVMKRDPDELRMWENGQGAPSYSCLESLAYQHFNIPLAIFFFPEPPKIDDPVKKFRRLPDYELERFSPDTFHKIRLAQAYQDSLIELLEDTPPKLQIHRDLKPNTSPLSQFALKVRQYLGITIEQQFRFKGCDQAFNTWRRAIENAGIFTFKDSFKDKFVSGFCLFHEEAPIIMVNNSNAFARQIFTIIHELGHILLGINGVTDIEESYIEFMDSMEQSLEVKCNRFTSEVLVPSSAFKPEILLFKKQGIDIVPKLAQKYSVSREVILRRLLDYGAIDQEYYGEHSAEWNKDYLRVKQKVSRGNWYLTHLAYVGEGFARLAFEKHRQGRFDKTALAGHLNVKARNIDKFRAYLG